MSLKYTCTIRYNNNKGQADTFNIEYNKDVLNKLKKSDCYKHEIEIRNVDNIGKAISLSVNIKDIKKYLSEYI